MRKMAYLRITLGVIWLTYALTTKAAEPILIGQSAPLTGPAAGAGVAFVNGARAYLDQVNREGGINGQRIELRTMDDGYLAQRAAENAKTLIDAGAVGLFGFVNTPTSIAGSKVAIEHRVPFVAPASGASALRASGNQLVFNVRASFAEETTRIVSHLQALGTQRISFFSLQIPESKVSFDHMSDLLRKSGGEFFSVANVEAAKVDLAKAAAELQPKQTQAIVMLCPGKMCADLIAEIRKQGGAPNFYTISSAGDVFGELADQGLSIAVTQVMPDPWRSTSLIVREYQMAMKSTKDWKLGYWSLEGYISARVLVEGLRRINGKPSPSTLAAALRSIGTLNLGGFEVTIDKGYMNGSRYTDITLARGGGHYLR